MEVEVVRAPADVWGDDIIDPLLGAEAAGVARGEHALDEAHPARTVQLSIAHEAAKPGQAVTVADDFQGQVYQGLITAVQYEAGIDPDGNATRGLTIDLVVPRNV